MGLTGMARGHRKHDGAGRFRGGRGDEASGGALPAAGGGSSRREQEELDVFSERKRLDEENVICLVHFLSNAIDCPLFKLVMAFNKRAYVWYQCPIDGPLLFPSNPVNFFPHCIFYKF